MRRLTLVLLSLSCACMPLDACKQRSVEEQKKIDIKLCQASVNADLSQIKYALAHGADPNTTQCGEYAQVGYPTPLFFALVGVDREADELLGRAGKKYHPDEMERLTVMALLAAGAKPDAKSNTKFQETPLMYASFLKADGIAQALKEGGADTNVRDANGRTANDYASLAGEDLQGMATGHLVVRLAIALADQKLAEKELINDVVPQK